VTKHPNRSRHPLRKRMMAHPVALGAALWAAAVSAEPLQVAADVLPVAEVGLAGKGPYRFILDTGASNTNLLPALRKARPDLPLAKAQGPLQGANGAAQAQTVSIDRLSYGGQTFRDLNAFVLPPSPIDTLGIDGVIGADTLSGYALEIDMPAKRWSLVVTPTPAMLAGMLTPVPFILDSAKAPRLTVMVDGKPIPALLDTGARATFINWKAAAMLGYSEADPRLTGGGKAMGATNSSASAFKATTTSTLVIGNHRWNETKLRVADLPIFAVVGMADGPALILGMDALSSRRFVVDYPGKRLLIAAE
jgi:predicted aspartyl protease